MTYTVNGNVISGNTFVPATSGTYTISGSRTEVVDSENKVNTSDSITVTVSPFAITGATEVIIGGNSTQLSCNAPDGAVVTWLSSDTTNKIAVDDSGRVTASNDCNDNQTATITATFNDGTNRHTATYTVTAKDDSSRFKMSPKVSICYVNDKATFTSLNGHPIDQCDGNWINN